MKQIFPCPVCSSVIVHTLVDAYKGMSVLILSSSPIIGQFDFKARVDFIRILGVVKLRDGDTHLNNQHTAEIYSPDIFLVDKEAWGFEARSHKH